MSNDILNILANTELLLTHLSKEEWQNWAVEHKGRNLFFGMGIMTHKAISVAVPFDILGMFFVAELLRRAVKAEKVFVLVADQHATTNKLVPIEEVIQTTKETLSIVHSIIRNFGLSHFEVVQTTTLNSNPDIRNIYRNLPQIENDYLKHEIADTLWLHQFHQVGIKLGWAMSKESKVQGHDERFFDAEITSFCPDVSFIHTKPGRTADKKRQRVSPYISIKGEDRLVLTKDEHPQEKIERWKLDKDNDGLKPLLRHLSQISRLHDKLFSPLMFMSSEEKIRFLTDKAMKISKGT